VPASNHTHLWRQVSTVPSHVLVDSFPLKFYSGLSCQWQPLQAKGGTKHHFVWGNIFSYHIPEMHLARFYSLGYCLQEKRVILDGWLRSILHQMKKKLRKAMEKAKPLWKKTLPERLPSLHANSTLAKHKKTKQLLVAYMNKWIISHFALPKLRTKCIKMHI